MKKLWSKQNWVAKSGGVANFRSFAACEISQLCEFYIYIYIYIYIIFRLIFIFLHFFRKNFLVFIFAGFCLIFGAEGKIKKFCSLRNFAACEISQLALLQVLVFGLSYTVHYFVFYDIYIYVLAIVGSDTFVFSFVCMY